MTFPVKTHCKSQTGQDIQPAKCFLAIGIVSALLSDHVFNSHYSIITHVNEHRFASDFGLLSTIYGLKLRITEEKIS